MNLNNLPSDPHIDPHSAVNLDDDFYRLLKVHMESLRIADKIVEIVKTGMVAAIPISILDELGINIALEAGLGHVYIQMRNHYWWAGVGLCMMTHCCMEEFKEEGIVRFSLSKYQGEPLYRSNVEWVQEKNQRFKTLRAKVPTEKITNQPIQQSLF